MPPHFCRSYTQISVNRAINSFLEYKTEVLPAACFCFIATVNVNIPEHLLLPNSSEDLKNNIKVNDNPTLILQYFLTEITSVLLVPQNNNFGL